MAAGGAGPNGECTSIDRIVTALRLPKVDFIKLDIEGAERNALAGTSGTMNAFRPLHGNRVISPRRRPRGPAADRHLGTSCVRHLRRSPGARAWIHDSVLSMTPLEQRGSPPRRLSEWSVEPAVPKRNPEHRRPSDAEQGRHS